LLPSGELIELDPEAQHMYENSPIQEDEREEHHSPNQVQERTDYSDLLKISMEVKKKD